MKLFINIIKKIFKEEKRVLGRWNIDYCNKKINKKIDYSNEDHCGPCGQYILNKQINNKLNNKLNNKINNCDKNTFITKNK
jgi:hypothetical protein